MTGEQFYLACSFRFLFFPFQYRHTSDIESFNSMLLKYASKRYSFQNESFTTRGYLAAIDHNMHVNRPYLYTKSGKPVYCRKYSKRSGRWTVWQVKAPKEYKYISYLQSQILESRKITTLKSIPKTTSELAARKIAPTIARVPSIATHKLAEEHVSRK